MNHRHILRGGVVLLLGLGLLSAVVGYAQVGGGYDLSWAVIPGGGGAADDGNGISLEGTLGEVAVGQISGSGYVLDAGFMPGAVQPVLTPTHCTITFTDVDQNNPFYSFIRCLACRNIVSGYSDGTFRWGANVTRGQTAKIVANAANLTDAIPSTYQTFSDVAANSTFWLWIERLSGRGYISGYTCGGPGEPCIPPGNRPYFRWGNDVTRGQLAKIVASAAQFNDVIPTTQQSFQDVPASNPFWLWIERLAGHGAISGYTCGGAGEPCVPPGNRPYFRYGASATRGQMAKIAAQTFYPNCSTPVQR